MTLERGREVEKGAGQPRRGIKRRKMNNRRRAWEKRKNGRRA